MKLLSWNVNGLRAIVKKDFYRDIASLNPDILCLQETKMQKNQYNVDLPGYQAYWNSADKKGYSGTAVFSRMPFQSVTYGIGIDEHDHEGRVITCETENFFLVCCYTPNSQKELARIEYRMRWENDFRTYLMQLDRIKPVILCGDLNVAHQEIDLKNPSTNHNSAGFSDFERAQFGQLLESGFTDSFLFLSRSDGGIQLVELYRRGTFAQCRMAHRLFCGIQSPDRSAVGCENSFRNHGQRPLSRGIDDPRHLKLKKCLKFGAICGKMIYR